MSTRHDNIDIVVIRENTEGEYSSLEHEVRQITYPSEIDYLLVRLFKLYEEISLILYGNWKAIVTKVCKTTLVIQLCGI